MEDVMVINEIKTMSNKELAIRMVNYIERIQGLMDEVNAYICRKDEYVDKDTIRKNYKNIKEDIKRDSHYVNLARNKNCDNKLYSNIFSLSIAEASAWGFSLSTNCSIDFRLFNSLAEAQYKLTKYYSYEKWKTLSEQ